MHEIKLEKLPKCFSRPNAPNALYGARHPALKRTFLIGRETRRVDSCWRLFELEDGRPAISTYGFPTLGAVRKHLSERVRTAREIANVLKEGNA